jgi:ABC-2 type transport system permease protein
VINSAIVFKTLRDSAVTVSLASIGVVSFVILLVPMMLNMGTEVLEFVSKVGFIRKIFEVTLGIEVDGEISVNILFAVGFTHGTVLMLTWGTLIATTTRVIVGEFERGTADLLLTLPVTRAEVFMSTTLAWIVVAAILSLCPIVGVWIGSQWFATEEVVEMSRYIAPTVNFFAINVAIASLSTLISCVLNRRAPAVGTVVGIAFVSVVLNFVEPFIAWVQNVRYFGLLHYYRPVDIVRTGEWPHESIASLLFFAIVCWLIGLAVYCRRDIPTA